MNKYYCLYCKHYKPIQCGSEGTEPEGICCNPHTTIDYVYGHEYCEQYDERKEIQSRQIQYISLKRKIDKKVKIKFI